MSAKTTFSYTGNVQSWTVPSNLANDRVALDMKGSCGGSAGGSGATGGGVGGALLVAVNDVLNMLVGDAGIQGGVATRYNGGGAGGQGTSLSGNSGGGAVDVRQNGTALANRVAVAAGGGGQGRGTGVAAAGQGGPATGASGSQNGSAQQAPTGGTQTAGGTGGNGPANAATAGAGTSGAGGNGGTNNNTGSYGGGGGGGGYYGGGAGGSVNPGSSGGYSGSGAGGSNYVGGLTTVTINDRGSGPVNTPGYITVTYSLKSSPSIQAPTNDEGDPYDTDGNMAIDKVCYLSFVFTSPEPNSTDYLTRADYRWRVSGATSWNTVTNPIFATDGGGVTRVSVPANTFAGLADQVIEYQIQTYGAGLYADGNNPMPGDWSASNYLRPRNRPALPTWTAPVLIARNPPMNAATTADSTIDYQVDLYSDSGGNAGGLLTTASPAAFAATTNVSVNGPSYAYANQTTYHLKLRTSKYQNVWSDRVDSGAVVANINAPRKPTVVLTTVPSLAAITVAITNPSVGTDPYPPTSNRIYRSKSIGKGSGEDLIATNVALNGTFVDYTPGANWTYTYRVEAVNATTFTSSD